MSDYAAPIPETPLSGETNPADNTFAQLLAQFDSQNDSAGPAIGEQRTGHVVNLREDVALVDIGAKAEGVLPLQLWREQGPGTDLNPGEAIEVVVEGRDPEGSFKLSPFSPDRPRNLEQARVAFEAGRILRGKVTGVVKGGLTVDVGLRGFIPQSKSGVRNPDDMHKLVGQEIRCRIARAPEEKRLILDRRSLIEEEQQAAEQQMLERLQVGDEVEGTVASLATYGAFVDIGGVDTLLHVSDMSWTRLGDPAHLLTLGQKLTVKVIKLDREKRRISVGLKQLTPDPWAGVPERYPDGAHIHGRVTRTTDFGAFVELEPGIEGLIHISEMSWRRIRKPEDAVKVDETVEAVVLGVHKKDRRISLGLKQVLGDPWADAEIRFKPGTVVEGKVRNLQQFGAFVEIVEGVDGMIHIGDISPERIQHPNAVLKLGEVVKAQVLELDLAKRRLRLGMKQLIPTPLELFMAAHQEGEELSGRVVKAYPGRVQLDEGIEAACPSAAAPVRKIEEGTLAAKLAAVWKSNAPAVAEPEPTGVTLKSGEVRKFRLTVLDPAR
ncbi:MAG: S1 RNA-binding domain-containing protein, partial [Terriglobales bacterium]